MPRKQLTDNQRFTGGAPGKRDSVQLTPHENLHYENFEKNSTSDFLSDIPSSLQQIQEMFKGNIGQIEIDLQTALLRSSFFEFIKEFIHDVVTDNEVVWNWHIEYLANELQQVINDIVHRIPKKEDLLINICPSSTKSTIVTILLPIWAWVVDPTISIFTCSHNETFAGEQSNRSRDIIKSQHFQKFFPELKIKETQDNIRLYQNTSGGSRLASSTKQAVTGSHYLLAIIDDAINSKDAFSPVERDRVNRWYSESLITRKAHKEVSTAIIAAQRLHAGDLSGYLLNSGAKLKHICIPAEDSELVKPFELREKYINGLFDPVRLPYPVIDELKISPGNRTYQTQYNQNPIAEGSQIILEDWFKKISSTEFERLVDGKKYVIDFFIDPSYGKPNRDYTAIIACTTINKKLYVTNLSRVKKETYELLKHLESWTYQVGRTSSSRLFVEQRANGQTIVELLERESGMNVIKFPYQKDGKETKLQAVAPMFEAGRVVLINDDNPNKERGWNQVLIDEICVGGTKNDDSADALVMAVMQNLAMKAPSKLNLRMGFY